MPFGADTAAPAAAVLERPLFTEDEIDNDVANEEEDLTTALMLPTAAAAANPPRTKRNLLLAPVPVRGATRDMPTDV